MSDEILDPPDRLLLEAVAFATRAHRHHLRKDGQTPYVSHVVRVMLVVRHVFGISNPAVLTAAVLHDTVEDTTTDFDDLAEMFTPQVAAWVAALSKDKRKAEGPRELAYRKTLTQAPWQVKVCKLADIFDNLLDTPHLARVEQRLKTCHRAHQYLKALETADDPEFEQYVRPAWERVRRLLQETESKWRAQDGG